MADSVNPGIAALRDGAAVLDLSARGRIRVTGEDRARLLHAMCTNNVQPMKPGDGLYAFFLSAQGRIVADAYILCLADHFLLDTEPETRHSLLEHLDRFIIADDVALDDITDQTCCLGVEGPRAAEILAGVALPPPAARYTHVEWGDAMVAAIAETGEPGVRIYAPLARREELVQAVEGAGALPVPLGVAANAAICNFRPKYGRDITEASLPQETQQMQAIHFEKGCYIGQEIVVRIRSRGHVNKTLMGFRLEGDSVPEDGSILFAGGKEAGDVTSAAKAPDGSVHGIAYVRVPYNKPGGVVGIDGRPAELFAPGLN